MVKTRTVNGYKHEHLPEQVWWRLEHDKRPVFYGVEAMPAKTPDGPMLLVRLRKLVELANPATDVAMLVGHALTLQEYTAYHVSLRSTSTHNAPELWYYNDKFWVKARSSIHVEYYHNKCHLFYEVVVKDVDKLLAQVVC